MMTTFLILSAALAASAQGAPEANHETALAAETALVKAIVEPLSGLGVTADAAGAVQVAPLPDQDACNVNEYAGRVTRGTLSIIFPKEGGGEAASEVEAEFWTAAIQAALDEHKAVFVPSRPEPYYLEYPLVVHSGGALLLGDKAEMRMKPKANFCMVRNENLRDGRFGPVAIGEDADHDITVAGGIWTTLATAWGQWNGNVHGRADHKNSFSSHGTLLFSHVKGLQVRNVTMRQCRPHAIQISNCSQFLVDNVRFEEQRRDGVHINGPVSYGVIHDIQNARGRMGDDMIALNGWDWKNTSMTFGPIDHVLVDKVSGASAYPVTEENDTRAEIRLLPGTKHFDDGTTLDCNVEHCVFRDIKGIRTFKMYDQPNLELGRTKDFADPIGNVRTLFFRNITMERPTGAPLFQIALNGENLTFHAMKLGFEPAAAGDAPFSLIQVGPMSQTYKHNPKYPKTWVELFSPDKDCIIRGLHLFDVSSGKPLDPKPLVTTVQQTLNEDYPNTVPRGGTGKGVMEWSAGSKN